MKNIYRNDQGQYSLNHEEWFSTLRLIPEISEIIKKLALDEIERDMGTTAVVNMRGDLIIVNHSRRIHEVTRYKVLSVCPTQRREDAPNITYYTRLDDDCRWRVSVHHDHGFIDPDDHFGLKVKPYHATHGKMT